MPVVSKFIGDNWKWLMTVLIGAGIMYNQFHEMKRDMETVKRRQQTYIDRFQEQQKLIHDLEIRIVVLETTE